MKSKLLGPTATDGPQFVKIPVFAELFGRSVPTVYRDLKAGYYIARKAGRSTLVDVISARAYFDSCPQFESKAQGATAK